VDGYHWSINVSHCPLCGPGLIPGCGGVFQGIFSWLITLCQPVLSQCGRKWLNLPSMAPQNWWTVRRKAERRPCNREQTMAEKNSFSFLKDQIYVWVELSSHGS